MVGLIIGVALALLALAGLGAWVAAQKGRDPVEGFILGLVFGPLGVVVEGLLPDGMSIVADTASSRPAPASATERRPQRTVLQVGPEPAREPPPDEIDDLRL